MNLEPEMPDDSMPMPEINFRVLWYCLKPKVWLPFAAGALAFALAFGMAWLLIDDNWKANTIIIRHQKNMSTQADIPYLYLQIDFNTVMQTILVQENLNEVISRLNLDMTPEDLYKKIGIERGDRSDVIHIHATWNDPKTAVLVANTMTDVFLGSYARVQNSAADKVSNYFATEKMAAAEQLALLEKQAQLFRQEHNILDIDAQIDSEYQKIRNIEMRYIDHNISGSEVRTKLEATKTRLASMDKNIPVEKIVRQDGISQLQEMRNTLNQLAMKYTPENPKLLAMKRKVADLEKVTQSGTQTPAADQTIYGQNPLYLELEIRKIEYELAMEVENKTMENYNQALASARENLLALSEIKKEFQNTLDGINEQRNLITKLENRLTESRFAVESNISDFEIIQYAKPPRYKEGSGRKIISIAAGILTFLGCAAYLLIQALLQKNITGKADILKAGQCQVLGELQHSSSDNLEYFGAFQEFFDNLESLRAGKHSKLVCLGNGDQQQKNTANSHRETKDLLRYYRQKGLKVLYIESSTDSNIASTENMHILNRWLYLGNRKGFMPLHDTDGVDKAIFLCDESVYQHYVSEQDIQAMINTLEESYDVILWQMFPQSRHRQLYTMISRLAAVVVIIVYWLKTSRALFEKHVRSLNEKEISNVGILLCNIPQELAT